MKPKRELMRLGEPRPIFDSVDSILVLGAVRNVEATLHHNLKGLSRSLPKENISWYFVESNSSDSTLEKLADARNWLANFSFKDVSKAQSSSRLTEITRARSELLEYARTVNPEPNYVLMVDFDQLYQWENVAFFTCLDEFDALFCHQNPYYDIFALSTYSETCREKVHLNSSSFSLIKKLWRAVAIVPHLQLQFGELIEPLRVKSAFGGMALYRASVFSAGSYVHRDAQINGFSETCEHKAFHNSIVREFPNLFIDPNFRVPLKNEHSHLANAALLAKRLVSRMRFR